ncbi:hypothetical protein BI335_16140 [Enemella evansiae]|nr:hypothetical protein BI335_16140 [Enemella evansiae]
MPQSHAARSPRSRVPPFRFSLGNSAPCVRLEAMSSADKPLLVLAHGSLATGAHMERVGAAVADLVDVVAPDLPGHATRSAEPYSLPESVAVMEEIIDAAGERPVLLGGHSLGGFAALTCAARRPERPAGLLLMGCAVEPRGAGAVAYQAAGRLYDAFGARWNRVRRLPHNPLAPVWGQVISTCGSHQLAELDCPVLILGGALDQLHLGARQFARATPNSRVVTARGRSHAWPNLRPDEVGAQIRHWLLTDVLREPTFIE